MGDFNQEYDVLEQPKRLYDQGWRECQVLGKEKYARPISKTCHKTTTKDFIWISPELIPFFHKVETCDQFPDHLTLFAEFTNLGKPPKSFVWRQPRAIDWSKDIGILPETSTHTNPDDCTQKQLEAIAKGFEDVVNDKMITKSQKGLQTCQRGRSLTTQTKVIQDHTRPLQPTRHGHVKPEYHGQCLRHQQWYKQMRRLESIKRLIHSNNFASQNQQIHSQREWRSIITSSGFPFGFQNWWKKCPTMTAGAPRELGWQIPTPNEIDQIVSIFEASFRDFEKILIRDLQNTARANRVANPNRIFADIKLPTASPVEILDDSCSCEVLDIDLEDNSITLSNNPQFDDSLPIISPDGLIDPIICSDDKIWAEKVDHIQIGTTLRQEKFVGDLEELFRRFGDEWRKRWDRHVEMPVDYWDPVVAHFTKNTPRGDPMPHTKISLDTWYNTLKKKKSRSAVGPDGWSRQDLLHMPKYQTQVLLDLLYAIECGKEWPSSLLVGLVHSLEKIPNASKISQYRPITLFSVIYRCWSSIRSREILRHVSRYAPTGCFGNVPNRSASQVWMGVQTAIEAANHDSTTISGAIVDVVKCFNHLPRIPMMEVITHLGVHPNLVSTWFRALQGMVRRFSIRGSAGPPIKSSTGCAEGCGLSVVGMFAINCLIDCFMKHRAPEVKLLSFVDNMEVISNRAHLTREGLYQLRRITELLDIQLDEKKTVVWSNDKKERKYLRDSEHQVAMWTRELGGHVQFSKQMTNSVITNRIKNFKSRWPDIARSQAPYTQKLKAIKMVAWPNALHGITSVHLGDEHYEHLRTGALRGLGEHMWGASPAIHLSLVEHPSADPGFHGVLKTVMDFRSMTEADACIPVLTKLAEPNDRKKTTVGPCSVLLQRLHAINWHWDDDTFWDHNGFAIDLWQQPIQDIRLRLTEAWQTQAMHHVAHRASFQGISQTSPYLTTANFPQNSSDASILRKCLNGTFFTADHQKYRDADESTDCPFCHNADSQFHRHWECPSLEDARKSMPEHHRQLAMQSHPATFNHGWIPAPAALPYFRQALHNIPDNTHNLIIPEIVPPTLDIFTDGSCLNPACKMTRLASWAIVLYTPDNQHDFTPVGASVLPGLIQTITRAELTAVIAALILADRLRKPFRLWIDNDFVVNELRQAFETPDFFFSKISHKTANHDLLLTLHLWAHRTKLLCKGILKVYSHQENYEDADPATEFAIAGNAAADEAAGKICLSFPHVHKLWKVVSKQVRELVAFRCSLHTMFVQVGNLALRLKSHQSRGVSVAQGPTHSAETIVMSHWRVSHLGAPLAPYITEDWGKIAQWIDTIHEDGQPIQLWSWYQLYLDLQVCYPNTSPWYKKTVKAWQNGRDCPTVPFRKRCRWFMNYVTRTWKHLKVELPLRLCRPTSDVLQFWCPCVTVMVSPERTAAIDQQLASCRARYVEWKDLDFFGM